jgi:hypothetical protein
LSGVERMAVEKWGPKDWGDDRLSGFLRQAEENKWAVFERHHSLWQDAVNIDVFYGRVFEALAYPSNRTAVALYARSVSAWRQALGMSMSGALMEGYALIRLTLELVLYATFLELTPDNIGVWTTRDDDAECLKRAKRTFQIGKILEIVEEGLGPKVACDIRALYDKTIAFGAHPNVSGVLVSTAIIKGDRNHILGMIGLHNDPSLIKAAVGDVNSAARLGLRCIGGCYKTRLRLAGIEDELGAVVGS